MILLRNCLFKSLILCLLPVWLSESIRNNDVPNHQFPFGPGRLPSLLKRPGGSFTAGICALLMALHTMSFIWLWRCCLGELLWQAKPCKPRMSTVLPQTQTCELHARHPSLCATAILTASYDSLRGCCPIIVITTTTTITIITMCSWKVYHPTGRDNKHQHQQETAVLWLIVASSPKYKLSIDGGDGQTERQMEWHCHCIKPLPSRRGH